MSEHNLAGLIFKTNLEQHPEIFTINDATVAAVEQAAKDRRELMVSLNPAKPIPAQQEFNKLRSELFNHQQNAKNSEIRVNNCAGTVRNFEQRLTDTLLKKREAEDAGNVLGARSYEHLAQQLETELADAREQLVKEQRSNSLMARTLREWQSENGARMKELELEIRSINKAATKK